MSFTCIPVQIEPNKSPLRKRLLALLLGEISHLSSPSRSCVGRLIELVLRASISWFSLVCYITFIKEHISIYTTISNNFHMNIDLEEFHV